MPNKPGCEITDFDSMCQHLMCGHKLYVHDLDFTRFGPPIEHVFSPVVVSAKVRFRYRNEDDYRLANGDGKI
jgi:hypothetical protein